MVSVSPSSLRLKTGFLWLIACAGSAAITCSAQATYFLVDSTPYDRQMARICDTLATPPPASAHRLSWIKINQWMAALHEMPYRYSKRWRTPAEIRSANVADCKGKALLLYEKMRANGVRNLRFVIGKHHSDDSLTHAWLEWDTTSGNYLLDPTFNSAAAQNFRDGSAYIPLYAYLHGRKYWAANTSLFAETQLLSAPAATSPNAKPQQRNGRSSRSSPAPSTSNDWRPGVCATSQPPSRRSPARQFRPR